MESYRDALHKIQLIAVAVQNIMSP